VPTNYVAKWDGSAWSALGSGIGPSGSSVSALAVSETNLYAEGLSFSTAGEVPANYIAKWDGSSWSALGSGMDDWVAALAVSGTNLYAGGWFITAGGVPANYIAKWDGSAWSALGSGMGGTYSTPPCVYGLAVSGTNLYAGGYYVTAGGVRTFGIAKWNGNVWSALGSGIGGSYPLVQALAASGTNLYAGGNFATAGGVPANYVAKWDGSAWSALGSGIGGDVFALAVSGSNLYAVGYFTTAGGVPANFISKWNGSAWSALGSGLGSRTDGFSPDVRALAVSGTDLYVGGDFVTAGGVRVNGIAKWNGSTWSALGSGMGGSWPSPKTSELGIVMGGMHLVAGIPV
jgi:hypothetical protein